MRFHHFVATMLLYAAYLWHFIYGIMPEEEKAVIFFNIKLLHRKHNETATAHVAISSLGTSGPRRKLSEFSEQCNEKTDGA